MLVTDNVAHLSVLHRQRVTAGEHHCGIVFAAPARFPRSKRTLGLWIDALAGLLEEISQERARVDRCHWLRAPTGQA